MRYAALALILVHAGVLIGHDVAHRGLGVGLLPWQTVYAYTLIVAGPLLAGGLLLAGRARLGYRLLASFMFAAMVFGVYHHYVGISPDHVDHLPAGEHQSLFRHTALWMALVEIAGTALDVGGARRANG